MKDLEVNEIVGIGRKKFQIKRQSVAPWYVLQEYNRDE